MAAKLTLARTAAAALLLAAVCTQACPFASMMQGAEDQPALEAQGRNLLQQGSCAIAALDQANQAAPPAGPKNQTSVDLAVKAVAKQIIFSSTDRNAPGVGAACAPARNVRHGALLRQAFHECGTYNKAARTGGCNGSFRVQAEWNNPTNRNMAGTVAQVQRWRQLINAELNKQIAAGKLPAGTQISYADVFQLAGAAAVVAACGPTDLFDQVEMGRIDWATRSDNVAQLPARNMGFSTLACLFLDMGYTLQDLVALSAGHTLGFVNGRPMTPNPQTFEAYDYFQRVSRGAAAFRTDNALVDARTFQLVRKWSSAANQGDLFAAFSAAYVKMGRMNVVWQSYPQDPKWVRA